jgi:UDP-N-acetylmuramoyl-tripeptide--D-alanyl-D-alanine ligase
MALWNIQEFTSFGEVIPKDATVEITGVCIDSRQIKSGELFIALSGDPGPRFNGGVDNPRDGHEFIDAAIAGGAAAVLLSEPPAEISVPYIKVADTLDGLWDLAREGRVRSAAKVVAITGSAGKTTAKSWLSECIKGQCQVHSSVGSLNNHWGVPLSLARMAKQAEAAVIEIGTNHPGEIAPLSELAAPNVAMLLNVLPAHIGNFPSLQALTKEKLSIAAGLQANGVFILPKALGSGAENEVTFGFEPDADVTATYEVSGEAWQVRARIKDQVVVYEMLEGGEHRILTSLAVLAAVAALGYSVPVAAAELSRVGSPEGRGNTHTNNGITVIDDSYNANPVSMIYAINNLASKSGRSIALLGEMLELGDESQQYHSEVAEQFAALDEVITVGDGFRHCQGSSHFASVAEIDIAAFAATLQAGDQVLVKGSNKVFWQHQFVSKLLTALK